MMTIAEFDFAARTERNVEAAALADWRSKPLYWWIDLVPQSDEETRALLALLGVNAVVTAEVVGADEDGRYDVHEDCLYFTVTESAIVDGRLAVVTADVVLGQRLLIDVHNSRAVHASGSHTHASEKLWRVWTVTESQNLNLDHGPSSLRRDGRRTARREHGCQERQDQHSTSHQMIVASRVSEGGIS